MLKRQNRRVYLLAFLDDHSRFITGYGLFGSQSTPLVIEVVRAAIAAYGVSAEILIDNATQYVMWRGKSQFTKELEKLGIKQLVANPKGRRHSARSSGSGARCGASVSRARCSSIWKMHGGGSACLSITITSSGSAMSQVLATFKKHVPQKTFI